METLSAAEIARYHRQIRLPEIGQEGQLKLKRAKVLVLGAGGLGCPVLQYLASAGVGSLGVVDFDYVERSNLHRQVLFGESSLGALKVDAAKSRLLDLNPEINLQTFPVRLHANNVREIFSGFDIIVDGSDNFGTRYLVNDACVELNLPFVSAAIFGFQGQLGVFNWTDAAGVQGPSYRCLFPEPPDAGSVPSCAEAGVLGVLPAVLGSMQANEVLKIILGIGEVLSGKYLSIDLLENKSTLLNIMRREEIIQRTKILDDAEYARMCECLNAPVREIEVRELKQKLDAKQNIFLVDVREDFEKQIADIGGTLISPAEILLRAGEIPRDAEVILYCRSGARSARAIELLQQQLGYRNLYNLKGGILAWIYEVDSSLSPY